jgi:predicted metal-dependent hydrolase
MIAIEEKRIRLRGQEIAYLLKRSSRRRSIGLTVNENGLTVNVPRRASARSVETALRDKAQWVLEKLALWESAAPTRSWRSGETLKVLGENKLLLVREHWQPGIACEAECLLVTLPATARREMIEKVVVDWLKQLAHDFFVRRVRHYAERMRLPTPRVLLSNASSRWGSCNRKREVRLNWRLIQAPPHLIDYVVAHELAHLVHMDHSAAFWKVVGRVYPDYLSARQELNILARVCRDLG